MVHVSSSCSPSHPLTPDHGALPGSVQPPWEQGHSVVLACRGPDTGLSHAPWGEHQVVASPYVQPKGKWTKAQIRDTETLRPDCDSRALNPGGGPACRSVSGWGLPGTTLHCRGLCEAKTLLVPLGLLRSPKEPPAQGWGGGLPGREGGRPLPREFSGFPCLVAGLAFLLLAKAVLGRAVGCSKGPTSCPSFFSEKPQV